MESGTAACLGIGEPDRFNLALECIQENYKVTVQYALS